jgi:hypothetical protein
MVKKLVAVMMLMLCMSVAVVSISGCAKKKAPEAAQQAVPADSTSAPAADTTVVKIVK